MKKPRLIYIYPSRSSFISSDVEFLSKKFDVKTQDLEWSNPKKLLINWTLQKLFLIKYIFSSEAIVISFAGYFSLIPVLFGKIFSKKTLLILNGTDCVSFPEYNYGSLRKPFLRFFVEKSQKLASKLLPVDVSLIEQEHTFDENIIEKKQGFKAFFPKIKTKVKIIPNGLDTVFWHCNSLIARKKDFITVVSATKKSTAIFKGIDLVIEVAKQYPTKTFTIIGMSEKVQKGFKVTDNVVFYPFVQREILLKLYQEHQFYMQLSVNEGFGCALAEAMLCGCIPIVSNSGSLPNVAGVTAFVVEKRGIVNVSEIINKVLSLSEENKAELAETSRNHIVNNFDISNRECLLLKEINQ